MTITTLIKEGQETFAESPSGHKYVIQRNKAVDEEWVREHKVSDTLWGQREAYGLPF